MRETRGRRVRARAIAVGAAAGATVMGVTTVMGVATAVPAGAVATAHAHGSLTTLAAVDNPRKLTFGPDDSIYVASAGHGGTARCLAGGEESAVTCLGASSGIVRLGAKGSRTTLVSGLPSLASPSGFDATGAAAVAISGRTLAVAIQDAGVDKKGHNPFGAGGALLGHVGTAPLSGGKLTAGPDLASYEAKSDPDKKNPTLEDSTVDSDPYAITAYKGGWAVTDAAANDLLWISPAGVVSTLAVFPTLTASVPKALATGDPTAKGSVTIPVQSVPTSVTVGPDGALYVGELTGFPFPAGGAKVFKVTPGTDLTKAVTPTTVATGFTGISDLAFDAKGQLYVLEIATGPLLSGPGALIRINSNHTRTTVVSKGLLAPTGLAISPTSGAIVVSNAGTAPAVGKVKGSVVRVWP